jgi:hypothetical protein
MVYYLDIETNNGAVIKITKKKILGVQVTGYNDSGADWIVDAGDIGIHRFDQRKFTLKAAMLLAAEIATVLERTK